MTAPPAAADQLIAVIAKNQREEIRASLQDFKGYRLISIRVWTEAAGGAIPTKAGLSVQIEKTVELPAALAAAVKAATERWPLVTT